ncbi:MULTISPECIES: UDP-4-amino-4,6-dideoxy-N-acetyl-beta-L-altrosamine transaminase [Eggerthella]|jgi:perosamine synthetase|uniref:UDP-4-amino-4, 6-dideoxy-N-acetyl-beta-L-altrosamine transaminase n=2 Tax=Eggerthella lenta TaxID=84112 RepID=A0A369MAB5_EGGLN|nr:MULTISPECIES: UDP-4-amino-4,6-dideoxy-N-acetyl-beta-L-altrosamine transaminase [Eggerthella]EFV33673.1 UDP-4-keto-6-deoxy-N-acetylglucosamine 4-aminotransferase [Eggerthella sp. 1_3_56FAA]EGC88653.1 UDP-4-keto-6-deoxy-N-acetylglucosamine 4-aminotransferase [Eggerthella sp. HGA1]MBU9894493.1 UDP-4-amino-4,6-dideoxy-N-acetyl-beta-L-altrosamine transaminase [Eggerthella lenta]MBV4058615.1 UDP-4-amino-4,6-dideoxy-N-acetyl-beta-L-altrosamine transaminase [Eggerthella lenta]MBV4106090.1 UDP-4-ami
MEKLAMHGGGAASGRLLGYGRQTIDEDDVAAVADVLRSDFLTCGPATERFERAVAEAAGARYATAVANGTAALHVACLAAGIGPGDEVVVSPITFAASANCVLYCGGTPVFADIDSRTWNVSPESIRERINEKTKAVIAVDFGGVHVDSDEIRKICDEFDLLFIEDAAHSIGTVHGGKPVGSIADMTTFSFHPVKTVTAGEGGAVATSDPELARRVDLFAKHGITRDPSLMGRADVGGWYYEQIELGYNYRISDIEAALGASQLRRLPEFSRRRRQLTAYYDREFAAIPEVASQLDPAPEDTTRHLYVLRFDLEALGVSRRFVFDALRAENIGVNVHYLPVYRLPYYAGLGYDPECCPEANRYYEEAVTLPLHCGLSDEDARCVVEAVRKVVGWCRAEKGRSV